jgi:phosphatidylglycerol lysyltransferase
VVTDPRQKLLVLLRRHGWNATSFQAVETEFTYWFHPDDDAAVAYVDTGAAWVVAGAPVASLDRTAAVVADFIAEAQRHRKRVAFFAVEPRFIEATQLPSLNIGQQPWWDPRLWSERHRGHRRFKEQLRRARAKQVIVTRVDPAQATGEMRGDLDLLIARWLRSRNMPPMSFLVALEPFVLAEERRYYVARLNDAVAGLLVAVPVFDRGGWFFEDILRDPDAPNGTTELMIDRAMRDAGDEGSPYVTLGLAPLAGEAAWLRTTRRLMHGFYSFEGVYAFKAKLRPDGWTPISVAWPRGRRSVGVIYDVLDAFAGGRLFRFGAIAMFRAPAPVLFALAALLVPWTLLLLSVETLRWFPSRQVQLAWGAFDAGMVAVLLALSRKWRRPLAAAAFTAAIGDGALTIVQASRYNASRIRGAGDALIVAAALIAPFVAAIVLWGGLKRR